MLKRKADSFSIAGENTMIFNLQFQESVYFTPWHIRKNIFVPADVWTSPTSTTTHTFSCTQRVSDLSEVITGFEMVFVSILTHNTLIMSNVLTSYDQEHHHLLFRCLNDLLAESLQTVIRLKHRWLVCCGNDLRTDFILFSQRETVCLWDGFFMGNAAKDLSHSGWIYASKLSFQCCLNY